MRSRPRLVLDAVGASLATPVAAPPVPRSADDAVAVHGGPTSPDDPGSLHRVRRWAWFLLALQLIGLLVFSTVEYSRFALTTDFGAYSQAWWKIAHGQLDPTSSLFGTVFWRNDGEFAMWPLSLLYHLYPHPVLLLWVQDLLVVATELVTFGWITDIVAGADRHLPRRLGLFLVSGSALILVADPWVYETIGFDFHFVVFAAFFVVLVGRDLWAGRSRRLWWWVALALICGDQGGLYLIGVGLSGVAAGARTRRTGMVIGAVGLAWFFFLSSVGGAGLGGRLIDSGYGYLVGPHTGHLGVASIVVGVIRHPALVAHVAAPRWAISLEFLAVVGLVGIVSPWGAGMALVVFVPSLLNANPAFLRLTQSFQSWPALPFVLVGSVMVVIRLGSSGHRARRAAAVIMVATAAFTAAMATTVPSIAVAWIAVDGPSAAQLARSQALIPGHAEVIASQGVVGRFADRPHAYGYPYLDSPRGLLSTFPVQAPLVVFVLTPDQGVSEATVGHTDAAVRFVEHRLRARVLVARSGVYVLAWSPVTYTKWVTLP